MKLNWILLFLALGFVTVISCNEDKNIEIDWNQFPHRFRLDGNAEGLSEDKNIKCKCEQIGEISTSYEIIKDTIIYKGTMGGFFTRTVLNDDKDGISLTPDTYGEIVVKLLEDSVWIITPVNFNTGSRFYENIAVFKGVRKGGQFKGEWQCAPFDIFEGGWVDTVGTVSGTWSIEEQQ